MKSLVDFINENLNEGLFGSTKCKYEKHGWSNNPVADSMLFLVYGGVTKDKYFSNLGDYTSDKEFKKRIEQEINDLNSFLKEHGIHSSAECVRFSSVNIYGMTDEEAKERYKDKSEKEIKALQKAAITKKDIIKRVETCAFGKIKDDTEGSKRNYCSSLGDVLLVGDKKNPYNAFNFLKDKEKGNIIKFYWRPIKDEPFYYKMCITIYGCK